MNTEEEKRTISEYYQDKTIFVTGASGLIGKVLIWKLLRHCPRIDTVYILVRPKHGKNAQVRVDELLQTLIFDSLRKENLPILSKVKAVAGDILEPGLGLSQEDDRKLSQSVHIIFHIAATVRFDLSLKEAVRMNVEGTRRVLELATKMTNLEALVHTSTMYCYDDKDELEEKLCKANASPQQVIDMVEWMDPEILQSMELKFIRPHPNTYGYTKRLGENVVADYYPRLPIAIARPSIVMPSLHEPIPGWVDNMNGPVGIFVAGGKGALRVLWCNKNDDLDLIPVDIVCNGLIVIAWKMGKDTERPKEIPIYNMGLLEMEPISNIRVLEALFRLRLTYPLSVVLWYPTFSMQNNFYIYTALSILLQLIPAYLLDVILFLLGYKTFMVRAQRKILRGMKMYNYYSHRKWNFSKNNILRVREELSEKDRDTFAVTNKGLNVDEYFRNFVALGRWYLLKDDPANLPAARFRMKILFVLHHFVMFLFYGFIVWMLLYQAYKLCPTFQ